MKEKKLGIIYFLGIGVIISTLVIIFYTTKPTMAMWVDNKIYDLYLRDDTDKHISNKVAIVDIDEKSLETLGQWPWPRYLNAILLENIVNSGAYSVGFDILMSEPDRSSPKLVQENLKKFFNTDLKFENLPEQFYDNDTLFASVLANSSSVLGMYLDFEDTENTIIQEIPKAPNIALLSNKNAIPPQKNILKAKSITPPLKQLLDNSSAGFINAIIDNDGVIRKMPLLMGLKTKDETKIYPNLALMSLLKAYDTNTMIIKTDENGINGIKLGDIEIPLESDGTLFVRYKGGRGVYPYISAVDIITNKHNPKDLEGKVIFVGSSAAGLLDIRINPFETYYPGIEVHASVVDNILSNHFISVPSWTPGLQVLLIAFFGLFLAVFLSKISAYLLLIFSAILIVGFWYLGQYLFTQGMYLSPLYIILLIFIEGIIILFVQFIYETIQKRKIRGAFSRYVSPVVVSQIVDSDIDVFKGMERDVTIMFTDIRGFTTFSEKLQPEEIVTLLNEYFTPMTALIKKNQGTIDKFIGDAIMAFWNAPLDVQNHQKLAINTAIQMQEELQKLNILLKEKYDIELKMGAGLHSGKVYVGNMGSAELLDYTIIGDSVNIASRVEGLCSKYGLTTILSEDIVNNCKKDYFYLIIDKIRVKGKKEAISVYFPILHEDAQKRKDELSRYEKAYTFYIKGDFEKAYEIFEKLSKEYPLVDTAKLYDFYKIRCSEIIKNPPENWDGVWEYFTK